MSPKDADRMANSVDPDQTAPLGAVWSGSTLFAQAYLSKNFTGNSSNDCLENRATIKETKNKSDCS